jgi:hypothetical protein
MLKSMFSRSVLGIVLGAASVVLMAGLPCVTAAYGQAGGRVVNKIRKGRLPKYYSDVVTEKQREEILKIQEEYRPKIDAAKAQLEALQKEMKGKISAVLTEEQKKKVEEAETAAKAKNAPKPADTPKPADPTTKPADQAEKKADK